jgi:hypothetical protein
LKIILLDAVGEKTKMFEKRNQNTVEVKSDQSHSECRHPIAMVAGKDRQDRVDVQRFKAGDDDGQTSHPRFQEEFVRMSLPSQGYPETGHVEMSATFWQSSRMRTADDHDSLGDPIATR